MSGLVSSILPDPLRSGLKTLARRLGQRRRRGRVDLGSLRQVEPLSREWGFDRGLPVDRFFIEKFLERHSADVRGRVLEVGTDQYTRRFGGDDVTASDVLHVSESKPAVTMIADLTSPDDLPPDTFDCFILTSTLQFIYDVRAALRSAHRTLKPGGVLLMTVPGISAISRYDFDRWGDYWRFTTLSLERLLQEAFGEGSVQVEAYGNVLASTAFLYGMAVEELDVGLLERPDPDYELLVCARALKREPTL